MWGSLPRFRYARFKRCAMVICLSFACRHCYRAIPTKMKETCCEASHDLSTDDWWSRCLDGNRSECGSLLCRWRVPGGLRRASCRRRPCCGRPSCRCSCPSRCCCCSAPQSLLAPACAPERHLRPSGSTCGLRSRPAVHHDGMPTDPAAHVHVDGGRTPRCFEVRFLR
jgi:hypothetical protein